MSADLSHAYVVDRVAPLPAALRGARALMLLLAAGTAVTVLAYLSAVELSGAAAGQSLWVCLPAVLATVVALQLRRARPALLRWGLVACGLWVLGALAAVAEGDPRGLTQLLLPVAVLVLLLRPTSRAYLHRRDLGTAPPTRPAAPPRRRTGWWRLGAGTRAARAAGDSGQGTMEYIGVFAAVAVVVALVGVAVGSPTTRTQVVEGVQDLVCAVTGGPGCGDDVAGGDEDGSGEDGSGEDGSGEDGEGDGGDGEDGSQDEGCSGFWGCAWEGVKQVGSGLFNIGKGLWDDLVGLWELFKDPSLLVDAIIHLWNNPSDLLQLIWDDESRQMWESGDYGGAIGRTIWNVGSFFIPGVNLAKLGAKGGKLGKLADLASELGQARKLADDAAETADAAADAARRGDLDEAGRLAEEAREQADEAAEQARERGCPVAAGPGGSPDGVLALSAPAGILTVDAVRPVLTAALLAAGGDGCGDLTDAAREADEAADRAEAAAGTRTEAANGGSVTVVGEGFSDSERFAAQTVADQGRQVVLREADPSAGRTSDLVVDGVDYDVYTPTTGNVDRIVSAVRSKASQVRGGGVVIDLSRSPLTPEQLGDVLARVRGTTDQITDIIVIKGD